MSVTQNEDRPLTGPWSVLFFFPLLLIELTRFKEGRGRPFELGCFSLEDRGGTAGVFTAPGLHRPQGGARTCL